MPYRRLPNTDSARLKSLKSAYEKGKDLPPFKLAFSPTSYRKIQAVLPGFENAIHEHRNALNIQSDKNKEYQKRLKKGPVVYFPFHPGSQHGHFPRRPGSRNKGILWIGRGREEASLPQLRRGSNQPGGSS